MEWFCIIAEERNISHFVRLKRLRPEVAVRACRRFNISDGETVAAAVNGEALFALSRPRGAYRFKTATQDQSRPPTPPRQIKSGQSVRKGVGENKRRVDSLCRPRSSNTRPREGAAWLCVFCARLGSLHRCGSSCGSSASLLQTRRLYVFACVHLQTSRRNRPRK